MSPSALVNVVRRMRERQGHAGVVRHPRPAPAPPARLSLPIEGAGLATKLNEILTTPETPGPPGRTIDDLLADEKGTS